MAQPFVSAPYPNSPPKRKLARKMVTLDPTSGRGRLKLTSMELDKNQLRLRKKELRDLWLTWDPIGVIEPDNPDSPIDEYDSYLDPTFRFLEKQASAEEIANYLSFVVGEYMGLGEKGISHSRPSIFAIKLIDWFEKSWADTFSP